MTAPPVVVLRIEPEVMVEIARLVVVAWEVVALPMRTRLEPKETAPATFRREEMVVEPLTASAEVVAAFTERKPPLVALKTEAMVVEPVRYEEPVVVAPPEMVRPPIWEPEPIVDDACEMSPLEVVKKVEDAYGKLLERVVEVAVKFGAK